MFSNQPLKCDVDLPPGERSLYYQILHKEYAQLKLAAKTYWCARSKSKFSEDVFHDTVINCINPCCIMTNKLTIYSYVCRSYYTNMIRDGLYAHKQRCMRVSCENDISIYDDGFEVFRREVYERVKKEKGERVANIIHDYVDGYKFDELVKKYNIKNIHRKSGPLREYMRKLLENW